ncbi:sulfur carrier protein ThiS [Neptunomonas qingdaonensis]|uniref:Sulfur carrier protein n=1 Tax=Neptunomonas qingdaonensis TaxID=1045558 RepID=A0A1I2M021_9GAMM|nr:sulfur carrier protein ThiS [Neptunomonas qingdaonensis]SFF82877.1 sulfur carrier protein [Neptunomonas qingdaonensis]
MELEVNGEVTQLAEGASLHDLVIKLDIVGQRIAIEVNQEIVPRSQHALHQLSAGDKVEVVHAIGGG